MGLAELALLTFLMSLVPASERTVPEARARADHRLPQPASVTCPEGLSQGSFGRIGGSAPGTRQNLSTGPCWLSPWETVPIRYWVGSRVTPGHPFQGSLLANDPELLSTQLTCTLGSPPRTHALGGVVFAEPGCGHVSVVLAMGPRVDV